MENKDPLLEEARKIMSRQLSSKPVLRSGSFSEKKLKNLFHLHCMETMDDSVTGNITANILTISEPNFR